MSEPSPPLATDRVSHTPGPWHTGGTFYPGTPDESQWVWGPTPEGMQSGHVVCRDARPADARLIAAAPELLAALKRMAATNRGNADTHEPGCRCVVHEADAAIAKAEGR